MTRRYAVRISGEVAGREPDRSYLIAPCFAPAWVECQPPTTVASAYAWTTEDPAEAAAVALTYGGRVVVLVVDEGGRRVTEVQVRFVVGSEPADGQGPKP